MDKKILQLIQHYCKYKIEDSVQKIDIKLNYDRVFDETTSFLKKYNLGLEEVSLKLPFSTAKINDYVDEKEGVEYTAEIPNITSYVPRRNTTPSENYSFWHLDFEKSYIKDLAKELEDISGFKIGRIRLAWLKPNSGYPIHVDLEPLRFHVPIITNKKCFFLENEKLYQMHVGSLYHLFTSAEHTAHNWGRLPRLHLIFSSYYEKELEDEIKRYFSSEQPSQNVYDHIIDLDEKTKNFLLYLSFHSNKLDKTLKFKEILKTHRK